MSNTEYRAYFFGNMYLSQIQQGIQAAHVVAEMSIAYKKESELTSKAYNVYWDWALNHKTMILLNGGYQSVLCDIYDRVRVYAKMIGLPIARFHEEHDSLNGALTSVGIIIPNFIYDYKNPFNFKDGEADHQNDFIDFIKGYDDAITGLKLYGDGYHNVCYELHRLIKQFKLA